MYYQRKHSLITSWGCKYLSLNGWGRLRYEDTKLLLKVIPETKLNPVASRPRFAFSVCDIRRQRHSCSTYCLALALFYQGNYCSTSAKLNRYVSLPLPQAVQCCIFPALLPMLKFWVARRGKVSLTQFRSVLASNFLLGDIQTSSNSAYTTGAWWQTAKCSYLVWDLKAPKRGCFWGNAQVWGQVNPDSLPTTLALLSSHDHKQDGFTSIQVLPPTVPSP